ncbi:BAH and coiled-coil domain-containing protein 1-like [Denticeps clupeoides]|uniref:BAH and coiled-coil domain-containing protein 1-like n=1 Tax=Denticeps clupeoides TaxID=299321 RepID=UPI0010A2B2C1|nr:BAH and coiled-coil domain-containing protein 1-like [Denticeps clupeoides]
MRISESPSDCLKRGSAHTHSVAYTVPPPPPAVGGSWLHPGHHHHHSHHHHHPHPDLFCPPPPPPLTLSSSSAQDKGLMAPRDSKVTGPTYVPSVGPQGDKTSGHFQLGNPHWRGGAGVTMTGSGGGTAGTSKEAKAQERSSSGTHGGRGGAPPIPPPSPPTPASSCQRKPSPQQEPPHTFGKADRGPEWPHNSHVHHPHLQLYAQPQTQLQTQHRSCSLEYVSGGETTDLYRPSLPQGAKAVGHSGSGNLAKNGPYASTPPFRDCSHSGPLQNPHKAPSSSTSSLSSMDAKGSNNDCALRDGQKVARIRHQQHTVGAEQGHDGKRRPEVSSSTSMGCGGQQAGATSSWGVRGHPRCQAEDDHHKAYTESIGNGGDVARKQGLVGPCEMSGPPAVTTPRQDTAADHSNSTSTNAIRSLMKYSSQSLPLSHQKSPFGGLGCLKQGQSKTAGNPGGSCVLQDGKSKQGVGSRRGSPGQGGERLECSGRTSRDAGDSTTEGEVRQPPVGIAVAVARQREPPCRPPDGHPIHSRHGRVVPSMKGMTRPIFPLDRELDEERKREEQLGIPPLDRELLIRDNKERVEIARIHPSSSCHGDLTSHLIVPGGASQLGADAPPHAHPHWAGSPSLWMTGHSYRIGHAALHQNLGPGFSTSMPGALQPVLSLPQDPSAALVVLPSEPSAHPAHHLDMLEQPGLWPPVYGGRGPTPHMQHPAVYSRTQFLQHPDLYALQHQHQQHRAAQALEIPHRHAHPQRKPEDPPVELDNVQSEPRAAKAAKPFSYSRPIRMRHRRGRAPLGCPRATDPRLCSPTQRAPPARSPVQLWPPPGHPPSAPPHRTSPRQPTPRTNGLKASLRRITHNPWSLISRLDTPILPSPWLTRPAPLLRKSSWLSTQI